MGDVIREFLVALGYEVDENARAKFAHGVERATSQVYGLGKTVVETALAIQIGVSKMANDFERLYYSAQRTKSGTGALQALEYGAKTVGLTADHARGAVEGLMAAMRNSPGAAAILNHLGVQTRGRQGTEILDDTVKRLSNMPFYLARQYASILGIEDTALLQLINNYKRYADARDDAAKRRRNAGVDPDRLSKEAVAYNNALRSLTLTLDILSERIYSSFIGPATTVVKYLDQISQGLIEVDKYTNGWAGTLATVGTTALGIYLAKLLLMKTLFRGIAVEAAAAAAATAAATGGGAAAAATAAATGGGAAAGAGAAAGGGLLARLAAGRRTFVAAGPMAALRRALLGKGGGILGGALTLMLGMKYDSETGNRGRTRLRGMLGIKDEKEDAPWVTSKKSRVIRDDKEEIVRKKTKIIDFFMGEGWTRAQATGIAANLHRESNFNPRAVGDGGRAQGVAQWHPDRQENFRRFAGKDIADSTLEEQLRFVHHELTRGSEQLAGAMLKRAENPEVAAAVVSKFYERPADTKGEMASRGGLAQKWYDDAKLGDSDRVVSNVTLKQKTDIHVAGTSDPVATAKKVTDEQRTVNAEIVRNMAPVTR